MARNAPTKTIITATFTDLISDINDISFDLGATGRLTTNQDSDVVGAINELHDSLGDATLTTLNTKVKEAINELHDSLGDARLTTSATQVKEAINEIEAVFDASTYEITAGANAFNVTSGTFTIDAGGDIVLDADGADVLLKDAGAQYGALTNTSGDLIVKSGSTTALTFSGANVTTAGTVETGGNITVGGTKINRTGALTLDVSGNISLDAGGGNVYLKDDGTTYGSLVNTTGNLIIKSGSTTAVTFDGAKARFAGPIYADSSLGTTAVTIVGAINELDTLQGDSAMGTKASTVTGAIAELHDSIGGAGLTTSATQIKEAINEHEADIGNMTFTGLSATNISAAIRELRTELGNHSSLTTTATTSAVAALNELDAELGDSAMGTTASTVTGAIAELDSDRDDLITFAAPNTALNTTATTLPAAINEHEADIGNMSLNTSASNLTAAVNELHTTIGTDIDSNGVYANLADNNIGNSLIKIDNNIGDISSLDANINDRSNLVQAINSMQADLILLDSDASASNSRIGSLSSLDAGFVGSERTSVVNALNALYASIPEIYDENGTQLN